MSDVELHFPRSEYDDPDRPDTGFYGIARDRSDYCLRSVEHVLADRL